MILNRDWLLTSSFLGALAVSTGAIGSHMLKEKLSDDDFYVWNTGVSFAFYHIPCLLLISLIEPLLKSKS
jgi:uncharacterized membrane protein YgdD (TMEM256/DUF423 family)